MQQAKESQNQPQFDTYFEKGGFSFGPYTTHMWRTDPRKMVCLFSRYKFVAKMLAGKDRVLEIGCGDSVGTPIVLQTVGSVHGLDFEPIVIEDAERRNEYNERCTYSIHDITKKPLLPAFDAAFSLDVIEHIEPADEQKFIQNIAASLKNDGVLILGTPNLTAHEHASEGSRLGHINLKTAETMKATLATAFENVFIFSMNDEVVHTGFSPMAHYIIGMGVGRKRR